MVNTVSNKCLAQSTEELAIAVHYGGQNWYNICTGQLAIFIEILNGNTFDPATKKILPRRLDRKKVYKIYM